MNIFALLYGLLPNIIQFVENVHGKGTGKQKFTAAVNLAQTAAKAAADAGVVPAAVANDTVIIGKAVQDTVNQMKAGGQV